MPTYVFKCEGCGKHKAFLIHEDEMPEPERKDPVQKHCSKCRTVTNWILDSQERRFGRDRRSGIERRVGESH